MKEYKEKEISLNGNRKLINACKKEGFTLFNPKGEYNGFGYDKLPLAVKISSISEMRKFNKIKAVIDGTPSTIKTEEEKTESWINRLSKLADISYNDARKIANEKIAYKNDRISFVEKKQYERFSVEREKLLRKMERENPLRYIKNKEHAYAIIQASKRHAETNYENMLDEARELAFEGEIEKDEIKDYARTHYNNR